MKQIVALWIIALLLVLTPAHAEMRDYLCWFGSSAAAQADGTVGLYWNGTMWDTSITSVLDSYSTSQGLLGNFAIRISHANLPNEPATRAALDADNQCMLVLNRDLCVGGSPCVIATKGAMTAPGRQSLIFSPVPAGSHWVIVGGKGYPRPLNQ